MKMVKIVAPRVEVLTPLDGETILKHIELCARNCYKSKHQRRLLICRKND